MLFANTETLSPLSDSGDHLTTKSLTKYAGNDLPSFEVLSRYCFPTNLVANSQFILLLSLDQKTDTNTNLRKADKQEMEIRKAVQNSMVFIQPNFYKVILRCVRSYADRLKNF